MTSSRPAESVYKVVASPRLTLAALLGFALLAAAASVLKISPTQPARGIPFGFFVALGILNVSVCTWRRSFARWKYAGARTRVIVDALLHVSLLLVIAGGAARASFGFVGTQNLHVGAWSGTMFEWKSGRDVPLGFEVGIESFEQHFHPLRARVGVRRAATGEKVALLETSEKRWADLPGDGLRLKITRYDPPAGRMHFEAQGLEGQREIAFDTRGINNETVNLGGYELTLVAFRADVRSVQARLRFRENGRVVGGGVIGPNETLSHRGTGFFLSGWGVDISGISFCGLQATRDPGAVVFWIGSVLLTAATIVLLVLKRRPATAPPAAGQMTRSAE